MHYLKGKMSSVSLDRTVNSEHSTFFTNTHYTECNSINDSINSAPIKCMMLQLFCNHLKVVECNVTSIKLMKCKIVQETNRNVSQIVIWVGR